MKKLFSLLCLCFCVALVSASNFPISTFQTDEGIIKTEIVAVANVSQEFVLCQSEAITVTVRSKELQTNKDTNSQKENSTATSKYHPGLLPEDVGWHVESRK